MFTHLHVHTEFSLLDAMSRIKPLIERAKEMGMNSLAITDHGSMYGVIQFYLEAKAAGIKPIIGCEVYVAQNSRTSREASDKANYHLILLAKNETGYHNLIQLATKAQLEGFYYKPKVDKELLEKYHEGLIALSACLGGEIPSLIMAGRLDEAKQSARWYKQTFGDYYLEVQRHPMLELEKVNNVLISMSAELDIPLVATNDVHYINQEDSSPHDLLLCIGTNSTVTDEKRKKMPGNFFFLKTPAQMAEQYRDIPQALENAGRIAEMCHVELEFGRLHLPEIELPPGKTPFQYLSELCEEGLPRYYPNTTSEIQQRLAYELEVINKTEFANYFLVVWDIVSFVRKNKILFGVRGSAAASIVLHCLGITELDPIANKLVFERFLNFERREMPDIDLDFQDDRRDEVIKYVSDKYGQDHVAQIITFGTLGARAALRDVGRALGMPYSFVDRVVRLIPFSPTMTLKRALEENSELKQIYEDDTTVRNLIDSARRLEGVSRHASTHAAGVVISKEPLTRHVPLQKASKGDEETIVMTQYSMDEIAKIGLLKMDFLGLANLTILGQAKEIIRQNRGIDIDLHHLPMDDKKTFDLLASGETAGVFQLEGSGMRRHIKELKPTIFSDIAAMVALYRPGPMEHIPTFIKSKHGEEPIRYPHPALKNILEETYGVIVYQEQVLFIVQALAGYSLGQADIFRKAMGKKIPEVMKKEKITFMTGAAKNGFSEEKANEIFALIEPFAGYAFNKAHAFSYALIAYQTAYLKANFSAEYMSAFLIKHAGDLEKMAGAVAECRRLGIGILPPDVNHSQVNFSIEKAPGGTDAIRFGLSAIKNVGENAVEPIVTERIKAGLYKSVEDLCRRADLRNANKRVLESLIKAGALDSLGSRGALLQGINSILGLAQRQQQSRDTGQSTMFDLFGQSMPTPLPGLELPDSDVPSREKSAWEKELLGVSLSRRMFTISKVEPGTTLCGQIDPEMSGQPLSIIGEVASVSELFTRERKPFISATVEDISGSIEVIAWPRVYAETKEIWQEGNILQIEGKVRLRDDQVQLNCDRATRYQPAVPEAKEAAASLPPVAPAVSAPVTPKGCRLTIGIQQTDDEANDVIFLNKIINILKDYPGLDEVMLRVTNGSSVTHMRLPDVTVGNCVELQQQLAGLVGEAAVAVESLEGK